MNGNLTPRAASPTSDQPRWIVQKFGGTSIGKCAASIAENVVKASLEHRRVAVVGSARSSETKAEGTTNRLLKAADQIIGVLPGAYEETLQQILEDHLEAAERDVTSAVILERLKRDITNEYESLWRFAEAVSTIHELSVGSKDQIISYGEKLSCLYLTAILQDNGIDAFYVDASDIIDFTCIGVDQHFYDTVADRLALRIGRYGSRVPVVTGYFGPISTGLLREIGRGYTDLCAALVAIGLKAEELQIWKEVDGIFTADPRRVPTARLIDSIPPTEAAELASYGSEVVHPFTMKQVIGKKISIRVKNVMKPSGAGTFVPFQTTSPGHRHNLSWTDSGFPAILPSKKAANHQPQRPTAITSKAPILVLNIQPHNWSLSTQFYADIFSLLAKRKMAAEMISTSQVEVSVALNLSNSSMAKISEDDYKLVNKDIYDTILELSSLAKVDVIPGMAIISVVGKNMKDSIAISGKMFSTLGEANVNIEMISQGASEINISCVVRERDAERAVNVLHTALIMYDDYS
ncbi:MAG: Aspartokinase [Vezdaea aestivalis]|nr:MAG: Aspartokinase [Vezdaea aestivalis]